MLNSMGLHGAASRPTCRKHVMVCASTTGRGQLNRPARPFQGGPDRGSSTVGGGGSASTVSRSELVQHLQRLWAKVTPQVVEKDALTGMCLAPKTPGQLGRPVKVLTNHLTINSTSTTHAYRIAFSANTPSASTSTALVGTPDPPNDLSLERRQLLITQLAGQQGWAEGSWQYDPSSNTLFSIKQGLLGPTGSLQATLSTLSTSSGKGKGKQGQQLWTVSVTPQASAASQEKESDALQLLGLLTRSMLVAAVEGLKGVISGRGSGLLPPGVLGNSPSGAGGVSGAGAGGRRDGRGGRAGGRGRSGGRTSGASSSRSSFPAVLQFWESVSTRVQPTQAGLTLQISTSAGGVLPGSPLGVLLTAGSVGPSDLLRNKQLLSEAQQLLKGAKVQVSYLPGGAQSRTLHALDARPARKYTFKVEGKAMSVEEYFAETYGIKLKHADDWPCVMVSKTAAIPMELCTVLPTPRKNLTEAQTAELIKVAALPPARKLQAYKTIIQRVLSPWSLFKQWGLFVGTSFMQVDARVLPDAALEYANSCGVLGSNQGQWRAGGRATLVAPTALTTWAVLSLASGRCSSQGVASFVSHLTSEMQKQGMKVHQPSAVLDGSRYSSIDAAFEGAAAPGSGGASVQLVLVVLPSKGTALYTQVKQAALQRGIVTQCVAAPQAKIQGDSASKDVPYLNNLLLKINAKLGGSNWQLPVDPSVWGPRFGTQQLMVLGVDVTHGLTGSSRPSVAAVVGSHDPACTRYAATVSEQTAGHEVVLAMQESVRELLVGCQDRRGQLPEAILVFRDGVSDSMYGAVVQQEVAAIKAACQGMAAAGGSKVKVTYLVVSKSHGTRLFPVNEGDSVRGNVMPGTVVDTQLVAPLKYEFFINSHAGIQGTNRPPRINVLVDDNNLGPDGVQLLTYHLSSIYCACSRTLSEPAPTRYADKAARAGGFMSASSTSTAPWQVVQPAQPGMNQLEYRVLGSAEGNLPNTMWYV